MRWVVSFVLILLVLPIASALDISFTDSYSHFNSNPVDISFTTDTFADCYYSLFKQQHSPDFSCTLSSCTFNSCPYNCVDSFTQLGLREHIGLKKNATFQTINLDNIFDGYYDLTVVCSDKKETITKTTSFLYDSNELHMEYSLLSRERFAVNQESTFYAYFIGSKKVESVEINLFHPDKSTTTEILGSFTPDNGYIFSHNLKDLQVAGSYNLELIFTYDVDKEFVIKKDFMVVDTESFKVNIFPKENFFDLEFIDPVTKITTFIEKDVSSKNIIVPASRINLIISTDNIFSLYFQNLNMMTRDLNIYFADDYFLETDLIGKNKPLKELATYIFHVSTTPEYISKVTFDYSTLNVDDPKKLLIYKTDATSVDNVKLKRGEFYRIGSQKNPLYINEIKKTAHIFVNTFSLFSLVEEQEIGEGVNRDAKSDLIEFVLEETPLEGISRDMWSFHFLGNEYSFLINSIDGAIVHFEFSPEGKIESANVGDSFLHDLDGDQIEDISFNVEAITPTKVLFSVSLLTLPKISDSVYSMKGKSPEEYIKSVGSEPSTYIYLIPFLLFLIFIIVWFKKHHSKEEHGLSQEDKKHLDGNKVNKNPLTTYIEALKKEGMDSKTIRDRLLSSWPKDVVDKVIPDENPEPLISETEQIIEIKQELSKTKVEPIFESVASFQSIEKNELNVETNSTDKKLIETEKLKTEKLSHETESIITYVKIQLNKGNNKENIRTKLEKVGWNNAFLDDVFNKVNK